MSKPTVLITGCSDGGMGSALAIEFQKQGYRVFASARNPEKLGNVKANGIETVILDIESETSLKNAVEDVKKLTNNNLDILVNNAGAGYRAPMTDVSIPDAKKLFDLNVWSLLSTTQAFLPLLLRSKTGGMIVNNTSVVSVIGIPFNGAYNASKAAAALISENLRIELAGFGIKVIDIKTGGVKTNFQANPITLPPNSLYQVAREVVEKSLRGELDMGTIATSEEWAKGVVKDLRKRNPPPQIWRGTGAFMSWLATFLPIGFLDNTLKKMSGLDVVEKNIKAQGKEKILAGLK